MNSRLTNLVAELGLIPPTHADARAARPIVLTEEVQTQIDDFLLQWCESLQADTEAIAG